MIKPALTSIVRRVCLLFICLLPSLLFAVDFELYTLHQKSEVAWSVTNSDGHVLYADTDYDNQDTCYMSFDANNSFTLNIDVKDLSVSDTSLFLLSQNGSGILLVQGDSLGEAAYSFYSGIKTPQLRIVGGSTVSIADFPWQIYLQFGDYMCGGSIIGRRWILTAAHCTQDENGPVDVADMFIIAGQEYPTEQSSGKYEIKSYTIHEDYDTELYTNDIAILELYEDIAVENASYINLISEEEVANGATDPGVMASVTGWGLTNARRNIYAKDLQMAELPIVSNTTAAAVWGSLPETMLMAGYLTGSQDACSGDSGGPLIVDVDGESKQVGVVSWGSTNCDTYGGYTRISSYMDWILEQTDGSIGNRPATPHGDSELCQGAGVSQYSTSTTDVQDYEWIITPDTAATLTYGDTKDTVNLQWADNYVGNATLQLRVEWIDGWSDWTSKEIYVYAPTKFISTEYIDTVCTNDFVSLAVYAEGNALQYYWYKDNVMYSTSDDGYLNFALVDTSYSGEYYCAIEGSCGTDVSTKISLTVLPQTEILQVSDDLSVQQSDTAILQVISQGHNTTIEWYKDNVLLPTINTFAYTISNVNANHIGEYFAIVSGTCEKDTSDVVYLYVDQVNTTSDEFSARIWPSVTDGAINVAVSDTRAYRLKVFDTQGRLILEEPYLTTQSLINGSEWAAGMYFFIISTYDTTQTLTVMKH